jgi:crotonobetainyl-CoA:carnitine CoA-transferase CaiB-like acyl-CoA transferase
MGAALPLAGVRVVEFSHMIMGPSCGLVLGDLGCDIVKIEPMGAGDNTRRLPGSGAGFFPAFNRNKQSLQLDIKHPKGLAFAKKLIARADVLIENFRPGGLEALGLGYETLTIDNPGLIYCSLKGFLSGPYEHRPALDETVQMMGGLAYMTGPPGRPLRAGASVNDIMGGMFAVIGIMGALIERARTGKGAMIKSALFENNAFLVAQHMAQYAVTGKAPDPMPNRIASWGIYDVFDTSDGQIFIACVTDTQWR